MTAPLVLVLNAGSSSVKFALYETGGEDLKLRARGQVEGLGVHPHLIVKDAEGAALEDRSIDEGDHAAAIDMLAAWIDQSYGGSAIQAVGHRVVHGGPDFDAPQRIDAATFAKLEALIPLAPLHQPHNLAGVRAVEKRFPGVPQIACFDTAFHRGHPPTADRFAIPERFYAEGVRRYGFHGLSYEFIARRLREIDPDAGAGKAIAAHLGSGASMCALKDGRSVDSTMGFSAIDGLVMGTRSGQIDPGVLLYLMDRHGYDRKDLERFLYKECGLKGLSGVSNDMRELEKSEEPSAKLAIDYFVYRIVREMGGLASVLSGVDAIVFTAGIGERSANVRAKVCAGVAWMGVDIDPQANAAHAEEISTAASAVRVFVIPTDEEGVIARHAWRAVQKGEQA